MDMDTRVKIAIAKINAMSDEEFLQKLIKFGYEPHPDTLEGKEEENSDNYIDKQN